jgi:hypothetical protein
VVYSLNFHDPMLLTLSKGFEWEVLNAHILLVVLDLIWFVIMVPWCCQLSLFC